MTIADLRNTVISLLIEYLGMPVVLSDQTSPVPPYPCGYYTIMTPYAPVGEMGSIAWTPNYDEGRTITTTRIEQPYAAFSFTFCSENRREGDSFVLGEDEALAFAEKAQGFFLHVGYDILSNNGIVINQVTNVSNRTSLVVDEAARRYGFDVRLRYTRVDARQDRTIGTVKIIERKD